MKLQEFVARSSEVVNELSKAIENEQMGLKEVEESGQREGLESADGKNQRLPGVSLPIIPAAIYLGWFPLVPMLIFG